MNNPFRNSLIVFMLAAIVAAILFAPLTPEGRGPNGMDDRLFCESYCDDGEGVLFQFSNSVNGSSPACTCLAMDPD